MKAALLLLVGVARHQVWEHAPTQHQAQVWNALGAVAMIVLLEIIVQAERSALVSLVSRWWEYEEALVAGCSTWFIFEAWTIDPGQEQCSARVGAKLGAISLLAVGWIAATILDDLKKNRRTP